MSATTHEYDLVIVGAGPAGISLAAEAVEAGVAPGRVLLLEKGLEHSWTIRRLYPEKKLVTANYKQRGTGEETACRGIACITDMTKGEVIDYLGRLLEERGAGVRYGEEVTAVVPLDAGGFRVLGRGTEYITRVCAIAIGVFGRPNKPDHRIPRSLRDRTHFDVSCAKLRDREILVVGGGDSASEYAQHLHDHGNRVTLSYRRAEFSRMTEANRDRLLALAKEEGLRLLFSSEILALEDDGGRPRARFAAEHPARTFDHVVYALGGTTPEAFLRGMGVTLEDGRPVVSGDYQTNLPGLYLAGDLGGAGGSIITAFNSARDAIPSIIGDHLEADSHSG